MRNSTILKVAGIIYVVMGSLCGLAVVLCLLGAVFMPNIFSGLDIPFVYSGMTSFVLLVVTLVLIAITAAYLVIGILGIKRCNQPDRVKVCKILGIICLALNVLSEISNVSSGSFSIISAVISLGIPTLYVWGAYCVERGNQDGQLNGQ